MYEHEKTANPQLTDVTGNFQQSLHAANANSLRNVFTINMSPSFLLWWIKIPVFSVHDHDHQSIAFDHKFKVSFHSSSPPMQIKHV